MSDEAKEVKVEQKDDLTNLDPTELVAIIKETRQEAAERRIKAKELNEEIEQLKTSLDEVKQKELDAETDKDKKIELLSGKVKQLEADISEKDKAVTKWTEYETTKRTEYKEKLGEDWLDSFEVLPLNDLEKMAIKFTSQLPDADNGRRGVNKNVKLEGLHKDLELAKSRNDLRAQLNIEKMINEIERGK